MISDGPNGSIPGDAQQNRPDPAPPHPRQIPRGHARVRGNGPPHVRRFVDGQRRQDAGGTPGMHRESLLDGSLIGRRRRIVVRPPLLRHPTEQFRETFPRRLVVPGDRLHHLPVHELVMTHRPDEAEEAFRGRAGIPYGDGPHVRVGVGQRRPKRRGGGARVQGRDDPHPKVDRPGETLQRLRRREGIPRNVAKDSLVAPSLRRESIEKGRIATRPRDDLSVARTARVQGRRYLLGRQVGIPRRGGAYPRRFAPASQKVFQYRRIRPTMLRHVPTDGPPLVAAQVGQNVGGQVLVAG
mmetsp:Transcript_46473/g.140786  ORF Transcript_46473/g.140786 Transcript_46473/m.140786 type:complete len:297 (+) Transcript_46473:334-1224(+)